MKIDRELRQLKTILKAEGPGVTGPMDGPRPAGAGPRPVVLVHNPAGRVVHGVGAGAVG